MTNSFQENPFNPGVIVTGDHFFDREDIIAKIIENLEEDNVVLVQGQRRIGKTSLLQHLTENILVRSPEANFLAFSVPQTGTYFPVFIDMQSYTPFLDHLNLFQAKLAQDMANQCELKDDFEEDYFNDILYFSEDFTNQIYNKIGNKKLVLLFDEFDILGEHRNIYSVRKILDFFISLFQHEKQLKWILCFGQRNSNLPAIYDSITRSRPLIHISYFSKSVTKKVLTSSGLFSFNSSVISKIYKLTNGQPHLVHALGSEIFKSIFLNQNQKRMEINNEHIDHVLNDIIETYSGAIVSIVRVSAVEKNIIIAVNKLTKSTGTTNENSIVSLLNQNNINIKIEDMDRSLKNLIGWEIFVGSPDSLTIAVPLIGLWIEKNWDFSSPSDSIEELISFKEELATSRYEIAKKAEEKGELEFSKSNYLEAIQYRPNHINSLEALLRIYEREENLEEQVIFTKKLYSLRKEEYKDKLIRLTKRYAQYLEQNSKYIAAAEQFYNIKDLYFEWFQQVQRLTSIVLKDIFFDLRDPSLPQNETLVISNLLKVRELLLFNEKVDFLGDKAIELLYVKDDLLKYRLNFDQRSNQERISPSDGDRKTIFLTPISLSFLEKHQRKIVHLFALLLVVQLLLIEPRLGVIILLLYLWFIMSQPFNKVH